MANKTIALEPTECFYCSCPIEIGDEVFENEGSYAHTICYDAEASMAEGEMPDDQDDLPDSTLESSGDTEGVDGGNDE